MNRCLNCRQFLGRKADICPAAYERGLLVLDHEPVPEPEYPKIDFVSYSTEEYDKKFLKALGIAGFSLLESCVVLGIIMTILAIGIPTVMYALDTIRGFAVLLNNVVIH